jgi:uncharacterized protein YlxW (UPF0749 family)
MTGPANRWSTDVLAELFRAPLEPGYTDAAGRRDRPRRPRVEAAVRIGRLATVAVIGFLFSVAYQYVVATEPTTHRARQGLATDVVQRRAQADELSRDADQLRQTVAAERARALAADPELQNLRDLEARTGLSAVTGDGVSIRLADAPDVVDPVTGREAETNPGRVLDRDLQSVVNELWHAGAEAVAINGQRLTATAAIRAAGNAVLVDFRPVTSPYEITAIGSDLQQRLSGSPTWKRFRRLADAYDIQYGIRQRDGLTLPAGAGAGLRYARPPEPPSASPSPSRGGRS